MSSENTKIIKIVLTAVAVGALGFFVTAFLLQSVFSGKIILPQSFGIGSFRIQFYGLLLGIAALAGYWLAMRRKKVYEISDEYADAIIFVGIVSGFVGARVYHVISQLDFYLSNPAQTIAIWNGGLSIFGAALGAVLGIYLYLKFSKSEKDKEKLNAKSFLNILDWLTPSLVVGQIIGRFGNFVNYELYGYPTNILWKMFVPVQFRIPPYELTQFFHPLFLYEAAGSTIILIIILKLKPRYGSLFLIWLLLYNVMRFFLEFLRLDSVIHRGIRVNALVAAALVVVAIALWRKYRPTQNV